MPSIFSHLSMSHLASSESLWSAWTSISRALFTGIFAHDMGIGHSGLSLVVKDFGGF